MALKEGLAEDGFDPSTSGLWGQHNSAAPLCFNSPQMGLEATIPGFIAFSAVGACLAEDGFDPSTSESWTQHASAAPRHSALSQPRWDSNPKTLVSLLFQLSGLA